MLVQLCFVKNNQIKHFYIFWSHVASKIFTFQKWSVTMFLGKLRQFCSVLSCKFTIPTIYLLKNSYFVHFPRFPRFRLLLYTPGRKRENRRKWSRYQNWHFFWLNFEKLNLKTVKNNASSIIFCKKQPN